MIEKFKGFSKVKKISIISAFFLLLLVFAPSPKKENSQKLDKISGQVQSQVIDTTEKKPLSTTETKTETVTETIPYTSNTKNDNSIEKGRTVKSITGVNGERTITYEVTYVDNKETGRKEVSNEVTKNPINEVILVGTKAAYVAPAPTSNNCDPNYTPCVPNVSYDLDCPDIGFMVQVIGTDRHRFDGDHDGYGCESYN